MPDNDTVQFTNGFNYETIAEQIMEQLDHYIEVCNREGTEATTADFFLAAYYTMFIYPQASGEGEVPTDIVQAQINLDEVQW